MKIATVLRGVGLCLVIGSCAASTTDPVGTATTRSYRMGFSSLPPRLTIPEVLRTIDSISRHGDAALMVVDVPWAALLADSNPSFLIRRDQFPIPGSISSAGCRSSPRSSPRTAWIERPSRTCW